MARSAVKQGLYSPVVYCCVRCIWEPWIKPTTCKNTQWSAFVLNRTVLNDIVMGRRSLCGRQQRQCIISMSCNVLKNININSGTPGKTRFIFCRSISKASSTFLWQPWLSFSLDYPWLLSCHLLPFPVSWYLLHPIFSPVFVFKSTFISDLTLLMPSCQFSFSTFLFTSTKYSNTLLNSILKSFFITSTFCLNFSCLQVNSVNVFKILPTTLSQFVRKKWILSWFNSLYVSSKIFWHMLWCHTPHISHLTPLSLDAYTFL